MEYVKFNLKNKNILITGASSGIGKSTAEYLSSCGATVILVARRKEKLKILSEQLQGNVLYFPYDLTDLENIEDIFKFCKQQNIKLDGLVHCAGSAPLMLVKDNDIEIMKNTFDINYFSFVELVKFFQKEIYSNDNASIVTLSSNSAVLGSYRQSIYSASKAALNITIKSMAKELLLRKIRVNAIMPGCVETEMLDKLRNESTNLDEKIKLRQPLGIVPPEYVAHMIGYLISDQAKYMTGIAIPLDGGSLL